MLSALPRPREARASDLAVHERLERQIRHRLLAGEVVDHDLLRRGQDALHRLQVEPPPRDLLRLRVLLLHRGEALRRAAGSAHLGRRGTLRFVHELRGLPARVRHHVVGVAARLVDQPLLVLLGADHVLERIRHLIRRIDVLQLDRHAPRGPHLYWSRMLLQQRCASCWTCSLPSVSTVVDVVRPITSRIAASAASRTVPSASRTLNRKSVTPVAPVRTLNWTMNCELHDVLVARQHQGLGIDVR